MTRRGFFAIVPAVAVFAPQAARQAWDSYRTERYLDGAFAQVIAAIERLVNALVDTSSPSGKDRAR